MAQRYYDDEKRVSSPEEASDDYEELDFDSAPPAALSFSRSNRWMWFIDALLLFMASILFAASLLTTPSTFDHVRKYSAYSPAQSAVQYNTVQFNVSEGMTSPYVGASPAVDKAWDRITLDIGDQMINREELDKIRKPPTVLAAKNPRTGEEGYRVGLGVFYQLHCLNMLRKVAYGEYYFREGNPMASMAKDRQKFRGQLDTCVEMLRQSLMCESDIGLVTFHELPGFDGPRPDFQNYHVCRDFEKIRDWAIQNTVAH